MCPQHGSHQADDLFSPWTTVQPGKDLVALKVKGMRPGLLGNAPVHECDRRFNGNRVVGSVLAAMSNLVCVQRVLAVAICCLRIFFCIAQTQ